MYRYLSILNSERIVVTSSEALQEVTTRSAEFPRSPIAKAIAGELLGDGVILVEGEEHKKQRRQLLPYFGPRYIKGLCPMFWEKITQGVNRMTQVVDGSVKGSEKEAQIEKDGTVVLEVGDWASRIALDGISLAALGMDFNSVGEPDSQLNKDYRLVFDPHRVLQIYSFAKTIVPQWLVHQMPFPIIHDMLAAVDRIKGRCRNVVRQKQAQIAKKEEMDNDIMSLYLAGDEIDETLAVDQMLNLLAAGHETISVSVTWAIYELCKYPEWQPRIREEIRRVIPDFESAKTLSLNDLDRMPLLTAFYYETIRFWPPIPFTVRQADQDTTIQGQFIPKDTKIALAFVAVNRASHMWGEDSYLFKPERWLTPDGQFDITGGKATKYSFMSFNHGIRSCLGQTFARAEMGFILSSWIGRFEFDFLDPSLADEKNLNISAGGFSARPADGLWTKFKIVPGW